MKYIVMMNSRGSLTEWYYSKECSGAKPAVYIAACFWPLI